jgi:subtilisin family serine protease
MGSADPYLNASFDSFDEEIRRQVATKGIARSGEKTLLPMLLRVANQNWQPRNKIPDLEISSQIGDVVACRGSRESVAELERDPTVLAIEGSRRASAPDCEDSIKFIGADTVQNREDCPEKGDHALIAVIDGGIDPLHEAFLGDDGKTRIVAIWDQRSGYGTAPTFKGRERKETTEFRRDHIDHWIKSNAVPAQLGRDPGGHGTHVASIAAGRKGSKFLGGVAPQSKIVVVIPKISTDPSDPHSLGYSTSHVDALEYIDCLADELGLPVVVNLSQGMNMGAHDGTSIVELAFDNFCGGGRRAGRVVVKSAGNERAKNGHARLKMAAHSTERFTWESSGSFRSRDDIEVWFTSCDHMQFQLLSPVEDKWSAVVSRDEAKRGEFPNGNTYLIQYQTYHPDNGDSQLLVTIDRGTAATIAQGPWQIKIKSNEVFDGVMHAWLERDAAQAIRFDSHLNEDSTLSIPGTARSVIAVASVNASDSCEVARGSSYGPTRDGRQKPDVAAPGEKICAARAGTKDDVISKCGTSMAAPHVTGAIALLLSQSAKYCAATEGSKILNAAQVRAALCQMTKNFNGQWTNAMGYGVIDAAKLLGAFQKYSQDVH